MLTKAKSTTEKIEKEEEEIEKRMEEDQDYHDADVGEKIIEPVAIQVYEKSDCEKSGKTFPELLSYIGGKIEEEYGWETNKFLEKLFCAINEGKNIMNIAGTGSGKNFGSIIVYFDKTFGFKKGKISGENYDFSHGVIIFPTNALSIDQEQKLRNHNKVLAENEINIVTYGSELDYETRREIREKKDEIDFILMTPEMWIKSLIYHYERISKEGEGEGKEKGMFWEVEERDKKGEKLTITGRKKRKDWSEFLLTPSVIIIDELDFLPPYTRSLIALILKILRIRAKMTGENLQIIINSATIPNGKEVAKIFLGKNSTTIKGPPRHGKINLFVCREEWYDDEGNLKGSTLSKTLNSIDLKNYPVNEEEIKENRAVGDEGEGVGGLPPDFKLLIFFDNKQEAEKLFIGENLEERGFAIMHSDLKNELRRTLENFKDGGKIRGLIITSMGEIGLDIGDLNYVIIVGFPINAVNSLIQRVRRCARRTDTEGTVLLILRGKNPVDASLLENPDVLEKLLEELEPQSLLYDLENEQVIYVATLFSAFIGVNKINTIRSLFPVGEEVTEKFTRILTKLRSKGLARIINKKVGKEGGRDEKSLQINKEEAKKELYKINLREPTESYEAYKIIEKEKVGGEGENSPIFTLKGQDFLRYGTKNSIILRGGNIWRVVEVYPQLRKIVVKEEKKLKLYTENLIEKRTIIRIRKKRENEAFEAQFGNIKTVQYPTKRKTYHLNTTKNHHKPLLEEEINLEETVIFTTKSEGILLRTKLPLKKDENLLLGHVLTLASAEIVGANQQGYQIEEVEHGNKIWLIITDKSGIIGQTKRLWEKLEKVIETALKRLKNCPCKGKGCIYCCAKTAKKNAYITKDAVKTIIETLEKMNQKRFTAKKFEKKERRIKDSG